MGEAEGHQPLEEQRLPNYRRKRYYPIKIGEILKDRYRIIAKLGYGAYSTVWLAREERLKTYSCLKVCVSDDAETSPVINEVKMLRHLGNVAQGNDHPGLNFTRLADDIFEIDGQSGRHHCIATKPQGTSVRTLQETYPNAILPKLLVKSLVHRLLFAINWLHADCRVVHTDISPMNVLTEADDQSSFKLIEEQESQKRSTPSMDSGSHINSSQAAAKVMSGIPILTDFGQMRPADPINEGWCMPDLYRAPEVLLGLPWNFPVDLWSVGVMTLELLEGKNVFDPMDRVHNQYIIPQALAQYVGFLGPPPLEMIKQSSICSTYFDEDGNWALAECPIPQTSFEDFVTTIPSGEEKEMFLKFIRKVMTWDPEPRATANELAEDEWLMMPLDDDPAAAGHAGHAGSQNHASEQYGATKC